MTAWTTSTTATTASRTYAGGGASLLPRVERAARPSAATRLTRRGRVVVVLGLLVLLLAAFSVGQARSDASTSDATSAPVQTTAQNAVQTTVHKGDTLWSVARRIAPDNDPRQVVVQIRRLNEMTGSTLQVGQQLLVPRAA